MGSCETRLLLGEHLRIDWRYFTYSANVFLIDRSNWMFASNRRLKSFFVQEGSTKISTDDAADRGMLMSVSSWFHADGTPQEIFRCYESLAKAREWTLKLGISDWQERFCKDRVSLVVRAEPRIGGADYALDLT